MVGDGGTFPNKGQKPINLQQDSGETFSATFQTAKVNWPLMTAGLICDKSYEILMRSEIAVVRMLAAEEVLDFHRKPDGPYNARLTLKAPSAGRGKVRCHRPRSLR